MENTSLNDMLKDISDSVTESLKEQIDCNNEQVVEELDKSEKAIRDIELVTGIKHSEEQGLVLRHTGGMCIRACAGSGKTTVLTQLLAKRVMTGEIQNTSKVLCTTYSKAGQITMQDRIEKLFKKLGIRSTIEVKTMHAVYLKVLRHFGFNFNVIDQGTRISYIKEACKEIQLNLSEEDIKTLEGLLSYQINNIMGDSELVNSYVYTLKNVGLNEYSAIRKIYNNKKQQNSLIDFDDMQLYLYVWLVQQKNESVVQYCKSLWTDFYIDEAQDISKIQFEILRRIISDPNKLVLIGDEDQCIYQWRGAYPHIILNICGYYDIKEFTLSTNYRCSSNIVNPASVGIKYCTHRTDKTMRAFREGGRVRVCDTGGGDIYNQSKYAFIHIRELIRNGAEPSSIAVLSRNNQHLAILNNMLFMEGIYCTTPPDMKFTQSQMYRDIKSVVELSNNSRNSTITSSSLWKVCVFLGIRGSKTLGNFQGTYGLTLSEAIGFGLNRYTRKKVDYTGTVNIQPTVDMQLEAFFNNMKEGTLNYLEMIYKFLIEKDEKKRACGLLTLHLSATEFMYKDEDRARLIEGMVAYISSIIHKLGVGKLKSFLRTSEQYESGKMYIPGDKVVMSTMHSSKGMEWKHVIMFATDNVTFPSFNNIRTLGEGGVSMTDISQSIDEERRLYYVASTRAAEDLVIFTDSNNMSIFALEAFGLYRPKDGNSNGYIISMANNGELHKGLKARIKNFITDKALPTYYSIDVSDLKSSNEFLFTEVGPVSTSMSLDSMQTARLD